MGFATSYSRSFERLSRSLLADQLGLSEEAVVLTRASKDGGVDGFSDLSVGNVFGQELNYSIAFEAKLRSQRTNPGLDTFAKAMIIAFNTRRHGLAVTTNRLFSPQCVREAANFTMRTGLQFLFVDGPRISLWVRHRLDGLEAEGYDSVFLQKLLWENDTQGFDESAPGPLPLACDPDVPALRVSVRPDASDGDEPIVLRVETGIIDGASVALPRLYGKRREEVLENVRHAVASREGLHLLWGEAGVGKSLLISHVSTDAAARGWSVSCVNLRTCFTARDLFLRILSALSGVDLTQALAEVGSGGGGAFLGQLLGGDEPQDVLDAAAAALLATPTAHGAGHGLDHSLLLSLLERSIERRNLPGRSCPAALIIFQEATYAAPEVSDFLIRTVASLSGPGVRLIIESRPHDLGEQSSRNWEAFKHSVRSAAISEHSLPTFTRKDAQNYLLTLLPGIGPDRADFIIRRVGTVPLFLETARDFLRERHVVAVRYDHTTIEDLATFFEGITPEQPVLLVRRQVEHFGRTYGPLLHAAAIFEGRLSGAAADALGELVEHVALDGLVATGLFEPSPALDGVQARHGLIIDAVQAYAAKDVFAARNVALKLLPALPQIETDALMLQAREADLTATAGLKNEAASLSYRVGATFRKQHQLERAERYLRQAHKLAREVAEHPEAFGAVPDGRPWKTLLALLELQDERHRLADEEATTRLDDARHLWRALSPPPGLGPAEFRAERLRAGFVIWRADHLREKFERAEPTARALFEAAADPAQTAGVPDDIVGSALAAIGVTLKAIGRVDESRESFKRARSLRPGSFTLLLQGHSNECALALVDSPECALAHLDTMIALCTERKLQPLEMLHTLVDRSMALFLLRRYDPAIEEALRSERLATANGIAAQAARARNIVGCCRWAVGDAVDAYRYFQQAVLDAERSFSERFLWRMRINAAGAALEIGQVGEAAAQAHSAATRILAPRRGNWPDRTIVTGRRWYHALVQSGAILVRAGESDVLAALTADVPIAEFRSDCDTVVAGRLPDWLASSVHSGQIMITG